MLKNVHNWKYLFQFIKLPNGSYGKVNAFFGKLLLIKGKTNKCIATETRGVCPQEFGRRGEFQWGHLRGSCSLGGTWEQSHVETGPPLRAGRGRLAPVRRSQQGGAPGTRSQQPAGSRQRAVPLLAGRCGPGRSPRAGGAGEVRRSKTKPATWASGGRDTRG